jgi:glycerophosphoryl diester phosphodiesterase
MLLAARGKIIVDIDKGYEYYDEVIRELQQQKMLGQSILNIYGMSFDSVRSMHDHIPEELVLQVIINADNPDMERIIDSYKAHPRTIIQVIFSTDTALTKCPIECIRWYNALWPEQNGGHDDDRAVEENSPDETWGWLVSRKAAVIQTDRPRELMNYLRRKGLHE